MRSEHSANLSLQTKHVGKAPIAKKEGKYATIGAMLVSYSIKFVAFLVVIIAVKHFI